MGSRLKIAQTTLTAMNRSIIQAVIDSGSAGMARARP